MPDRMARRGVAFVTTLVIAIWCLVARGTAAAEPPATAELLADAGAVRPGQAFTLGVMIRLKPGWHVYWKNSGDGGLATTVKWRLPAGFEAGPVRWPTPVQFDQPGNALAYGYAREVLLTARVTAPADLPAGGAVEFGADVEWLCCQDACVPGGAKPALRLPIAAGDATTRPANAALFAEWDQRLPASLDVPGSPAAVKVTGALPADGSAGQFVVEVEWKAAPYAVEWFPDAGPALYIDRVNCRTAGPRTRLTFWARLLPKKDAPAVLETVLGWSEAKGARRGLAVPIRLR